jgi:DNA-binding LacI/PurR family transcriptional regulator
LIQKLKMPTGFHMSQSAVRKSKHQQIFETLQADIHEERFLVGDQLPTEAQLVTQFGASRPTVARALRELVRQGLIVRRVGAGTFVSQPESSDRMVFGLLIPKLGDAEIFEPICGHIGRSMRALGHSLLQSHGHSIASGDADLEGQHRLSASAAMDACDGFIKSGISGVFFIPFVTPTNEDDPNLEIIGRLQASGIEVVLLDRDIVRYPGRSEHDLVTVDHMRGAVALTNHLIGLGHRELAFWIAPDTADTMQLRIAGIQHATSLAGLIFGRNDVHSCDPSDREAVSRLLKTHRPTAIICENDVFAASLMRTLFALGIHVPKDISVAGYDDVHYSSLLTVALTTVAQPCEHLGVAAAQIMLSRIKHRDLPPRAVLLNPAVVVRESTAVPAGR